MQYPIQSIILPTHEKHRECEELFYKSVDGILDMSESVLTLGFAQHCDFSTYFNACSWQKWRTYTPAQKLELHLDIEGSARVRLRGFRMDKGMLVSTTLEEQDFHTDERGMVKLAYPRNEDWIVGFEVIGLSQELKIYGGDFSVEVDEKDLNDITLCLASTTYHKEEFIKTTIDLIKREIFKKNDDLAEHLYCHIIDNGRTLEDDFCTDHILLHPANNTGGSGGFSRGMIEALDQTPRATNVLLMDDDILVLPESIRRTYNLLRLLKPEYQDSIIAGAMLYFENPCQMHEDIGMVDAMNNYQPMKPEYDLRSLANLLLNEQLQDQKPGAYSAWWFSCIPRKIIEKHGLSLPIFVRGDDAEYGIRTGARFLTMNGICTWHPGFTQKTNFALKYFGIRNCLIAYATSGVASEASTISLVHDTYRIESMRFNYALAEIVVQAFEDYLKGPEHLKQIDGVEMMKKYSATNPVFTPLRELEGGDEYLSNKVIENPPLSIGERLLIKYTMNGQRIIPEKFLGNKLGKNIFNRGLLPKPILWADRILVIEPLSETGTIYTKDRKRFAEIDSRYRKAIKYYKKHKNEILESYRAARTDLTSEEFWRQYLGITNHKEDSADTKE